MTPESSEVRRGPRRNLADRSIFSFDQQNPYLRIFNSNVFVRDHDLSLKFYVDKLGFSVVADARFEFGRWVAIAPPDGSAILALVAPWRGSENYRLIGRATQIAFIAEDSNATFELWRSRGVHFHQPPQPQLWGGTFAGSMDADGNSFELLGSDESEPGDRGPASCHCRESGIRTADRAGVGDCKAGAGQALPPERPPAADARLCRRLYSGTSCRRRLLRLPRPGTEPGWAVDWRHLRQGNRCCAPYGQSASKPMQPVRASS
ncbi:MAG TPA: VOC family protein [Acidobacteriaceae bacterium]